jgi:hypothetical protein
VFAGQWRFVRATVRFNVWNKGKVAQPLETARAECRIMPDWHLRIKAVASNTSLVSAGVLGVLEAGFDEGSTRTVMAAKKSCLAPGFLK